MKRLLNVLGALVSDLTQNELAARGACRCHKFRSGGFGMELHTYGQALWNAKNITGSACVAVSRNWIWDPDETLFALPRDKYCSKHLVSWKGKHGPKGWGVDKRLRRAATTQYLMAHMNETVYEDAAQTAAYRALTREAQRRVVSVHVRWGDKGREMALRPINEYVEAVKNVTKYTGEALDVFLTTEDAKAVAAFRQAAPENWNVIVYDAAVSSDKVLYGRHGMADQARNHKESGYHSLIALVLAMQADAFVITSGSNWSRLMEELCLGRDLEPRCDIVDVTPWRPHDW